MTAPRGLVKDLSCALGVELTRANAPKFMSMIPRIGLDASHATNLPKDIYKRKRPFLIDHGPICIDPNGGIAKSFFDYPSRSQHLQLGHGAGPGRGANPRPGDRKSWSAHEPMAKETG